MNADDPDCIINNEKCPTHQLANHELTNNEGTISWEAVENATSYEVYLDDESFTRLGEEIPISEGEHKIKFSIGDYEIIRSISAIKGKTYTANFSFDLQISEE